MPEIFVVTRLGSRRVFFSGWFSSILCYSHIGDHSQEELAKFGYRLARKIETFKESCYIFRKKSYFFHKNKMLL
jgi:hypothetical protein